jgi:L-glyceraldehyde 3-phosphate reductase
MQFRSIVGFPKPVSALAIGSWRTFEKMEFEDIVAVLEACFDAGINFLDDCRYGTAVGVPMGIPTNEVIVGRALKATGRPRDSYFIADKLWWDQYPQRSLREQLLKALERLDDERVDLLYVDRPDRLGEAHPELSFKYEDLVCQIAEEMQTLKREGLIRAYGFANSRPDAMARISQITDAQHLPGPNVAQIRYSLVEPDASTNATLKQLRHSHGLMLTATTVMAGGILSGKYLSEQAGEPRRLSSEKAQENPRAVALARRLGELAADTGLPAAALALSFPLLDEDVAAVVFGARSVVQVRQNLRALEALTPVIGAKVRALAS